MQEACDKLAELRERLTRVGISDQSRVFNTEWLYAIELGYMLEVAETMAHSAINSSVDRENSSLRSISVRGFGVSLMALPQCC